MVVTSTSNATIRAVRRLHRPRGRRESGRTLLEGPNGVEAARRHAARVRDVLCLTDDAIGLGFADDIGRTPVVVTEEVLAAASDTVHPRGPLLVIDTPSYQTLRSAPTTVLVDVSDPGNVGTIVRTAAAFGWDVAVAGATADVWSPKVLRSSAANALGVHISALSNVTADVAHAGLEPVALVVDGGVPVATVEADAPPALLVGSEAHGLPSNVIDAASHRATIPMRSGVESLNAAVAAAVAMYEVGARGCNGPAA